MLEPKYIRPHEALFGSYYLCHKISLVLLVSHLCPDMYQLSLDFTAYMNVHSAYYIIPTCTKILEINLQG